MIASFRQCWHHIGVVTTSCTSFDSRRLILIQSSDQLHLACHACTRSGLGASASMVLLREFALPALDRAPVSAPQQESELRDRLHRMGAYDSQDFDPVASVPPVHEHAHELTHPLPRPEPCKLRWRHEPSCAAAKAVRRRSCRVAFTSSSHEFVSGLQDNDLEREVQRHRAYGEYTAQQSWRWVISCACQPCCSQENSQAGRLVARSARQIRLFDEPCCQLSKSRR